MFKWAVENELIAARVHHALLAVRGLERGRSEGRETDSVAPAPCGDTILSAFVPFTARPP